MVFDTTLYWHYLWLNFYLLFDVLTSLCQKEYPLSILQEVRKDERVISMFHAHNLSYTTADRDSSRDVVL